jgi:hypothetical protein
MLKKIFQLIFICLITNVSHAEELASKYQYFNDVSCSVSDPNLCVSAGMEISFDDDITFYPLVMLSTDGGTTWDAQIDSTSSAAQLPNGFVSGTMSQLNSASCTGTVDDGYCVASGYYELPSNSKVFPLVAVVTTANAVSYPIDQTITSLPNYFRDYVQQETQGGTTSCSSSVCMIVGSYKYAIPNTDPAVSGTAPMSMAITESAAGYTVEYGTALPSDFNQGSGFLNAVDCNETVCIIAGNYMPGPNQTSFPMLAVSSNAGVNWTYTLSSAGILPVDRGPFGGIDINTVSCNDVKRCIAAGYYSSQQNLYPLVATSNDNASTWTYTLTSAGPLPDNYVDYAYFTHSSCSSRSCVATGLYSIDDALYNMAATSADDGTWNYSIDASMGLPAHYSAISNHLRVSCTTAICAVSGGYVYSDATSTPDTGNFPWLATSIDGGDTWKSVVDIDNPLTPSGYVTGNQGIFLGLYCQGLDCLSAGLYFDATSTVYPMMLQGTDITQWDYVIDSDH